MVWTQSDSGHHQSPVPDLFLFCISVTRWSVLKSFFTHDTVLHADS